MFDATQAMVCVCVWGGSDGWRLKLEVGGILGLAGLAIYACMDTTSFLEFVALALLVGRYCSVASWVSIIHYLLTVSVINRY